MVLVHGILSMVCWDVPIASASLLKVVFDADVPVVQDANTCCEIAKVLQLAPKSICSDLP